VKLPKRDEPSTNILALVRDWLQADDSGSWLMILDNADDINHFYPKGTDERPLASFLPKRHNGTILVTSRSLDVAERLAGSRRNIFQVTTMDEAQGLHLIQNKLTGQFDERAAVKLLRALDYIPLAITQAAAYINRRSPRESVESYLEAFKESDQKRNSLLEIDLGDLRRDETVSNSVITTWQVTFEKIRGEKPSAARLLSFMSFFNPHGIPEFALHNYNGYIGDSTDKADGFEDDLDVLRSYSLVSMTANRDIFELHATVQTCTRAWMASSDMVSRLRRLFLFTMCDNFKCNDFQDWSTCQILLPHLESVTQENPPEEDLEPWANLLEHCARYMIDSGKYKAAEDISKIAIAASATSLGKEHETIQGCLSVLASAYRRQRKSDEAETVLLQLVDTRKRLLGEEHSQTLVSMNNLALTYLHQGRNDEAEELLVRIQEVRKRVLGDMHPETLATANNLVLAYAHQHRYDKAEEIGIELVKAKKIVVGPEHPDTLLSIHNLAWLSWRQGRLEEALELQKQVLDKRIMVLGKDHPGTLDTLHLGSQILMEMGENANALSLLRYCIDRYREVLGPEHLNTMVVAEELEQLEKEMSGLSGE
jgi:tetratricopeptide (TPR) repeat protein